MLDDSKKALLKKAMAEVLGMGDKALGQRLKQRMAPPPPTIAVEVGGDPDAPVEDAPDAESGLSPEEKAKLLEAYQALGE